MRKPRLLLLALASFNLGCVLHAQPLPGSFPGYPPPPPTTSGPAPVQAAEYPGNVVRAKEIKAHAVYARVIYAKEVHATDGRVARVIRADRDEWERGRSDAEIRVREVRAEAIYAKEIKADWIEADEIHAKEVHIGR